MGDIIFNIYGGNNQILPNATEAVQNFQADKLTVNTPPEKTEEPSAETEKQTEARQRLSLYINNVEELQGYISNLAVCRTAREVGEVVASMRQQVDRIDDALIAKEDFITLLLPFIQHVESGRTISNLRKAIDNAWQARKEAIRAQRRANAMLDGHKPHNS